jgi:hypothetical protein
LAARDERLVADHLAERRRRGDQGGVVGFIIGFVGGMAGTSATGISLAASGAGAVIGIVWMIIVVRMALRKHYGEFRLALVPHG